MLTFNNPNQSTERQLYTSLIVQYRRPCFYEYIDPEMCKRFVVDLITLYDLTWDKQDTTHYDDMDIITQELLSDIRYEINQVCKKANIDFDWFKRTLYSKGCIEKWAALATQSIH